MSYIKKPNYHLHGKNRAAKVKTTINGVPEGSAKWNEVWTVSIYDMSLLIDDLSLTGGLKDNIVVYG